MSALALLLYKGQVCIYQHKEGHQRELGEVTKGNWVSCHIYMVPSVLPYLFWVTGRPGRRGGTFLCLCYGVHSLKIWCLDISVVLSHPADAATSEERALNDLCNLPVSGNISLSTTPEALFPPYRAPLFNGLNFLFCFNL